MQLSPDQIRDMLLLQHIHLTRREQLAGERKQLLTQMAASHGEAWETRQKVSNMALLTSALTDNAAQDYQIDAEVQCAALRGVRMLHSTHSIDEHLRIVSYSECVAIQGCLGGGIPFVRITNLLTMSSSSVVVALYTTQGVTSSLYCRP